MNFIHPMVDGGQSPASPVEQKTSRSHYSAGDLPYNSPLRTADTECDGPGFGANVRQEAVKVQLKLQENSIVSLTGERVTPDPRSKA
jgi:hypothetical protein